MADFANTPSARRSRELRRKRTRAQAAREITFMRKRPSSCFCMVTCTFGGEYPPSAAEMRRRFHRFAGRIRSRDYATCLLGFPHLPSDERDGRKKVRGDVHILLDLRPEIASIIGSVGANNRSLLESRQIKKRLPCGKSLLDMAIDSGISWLHWRPADEGAAGYVLGKNKWDGIRKWRSGDLRMSGFVEPASEIVERKTARHVGESSMLTPMTKKHRSLDMPSIRHQVLVEEAARKASGEISVAGGEGKCHDRNRGRADSRQSGIVEICRTEIRQ